MTFTIHHGDCIDVMRTLPPESIDAVVTSPPYEMQRAASYGGVPEVRYPSWTVAWMSEVWRLLKPDGSVIINISPHVSGGVLADYVLRSRLALRDAGWAELGELVWHKTDAMPTGHADRPRRSWESLLWYGKHGRAYSNAKANGWPTLRPTEVRKYGQHTRRADWHHYDGGSAKTPTITRCSDVLTLAKGSESTGHPAPFPVALPEWCGRLICPHGGTILDPFSGSGSTGVACIRNGWAYIGIEGQAEYVEASRLRLESEQSHHRTQGVFSFEELK